MGSSDAHAYGDVEGRLCVVTEPAEGRSLANWLDGHRDAGTRPGAGVVQRVFDWLCAAVQAAHGEGGGGRWRTTA